MKNFEVEEIHKIYNKIKLSPDYFRKYEKIRDSLDLVDWSKQRIGHSEAEMDVGRLFCIMDFIEWVKKYNISPEKALLTSDDPELPYIQCHQTTMIDYDRDKKYDLHTLDLEEKNFDFFIFSQTLEHLYNPFLAVEKISNHLKSGAWLFTSVPTVNIPHMTPIHFEHFSPMGLAMLFEVHGFEVMEIGHYGSKKYINYIFDKLSWPKYQDMMDKEGKIENDPNMPCQSWILTKKR